MAGTERTDVRARERRLTVRLGARALRRLAAGLIAYGVAGLLVLGVGSVIAAGSFGTIAPLSSSLESERLQLVQTLRATSRAMDDAAVSVGDLNQSLDQARASSQQAATIARTVSVTMRGLADAMGVDILGSRPLLALGDGFRQSADELNALGTSLDNVTQSLARNRADLETGSAGLAALRREVDTLADSVQGMAPFADTSTSATTLRIAFAALVLWLAVPAVASLIAGVLLWRSTGRGVPAASLGRQTR